MKVRANRRTIRSARSMVGTVRPHARTAARNGRIGHYACVSDAEYAAAQPVLEAICRTAIPGLGAEWRSDEGFRHENGWPLGYSVIGELAMARVEEILRTDGFAPLRQLGEVIEQVLAVPSSPLTGLAVDYVKLGVFESLCNRLSWAPDGDTLADEFMRALGPSGAEVWAMWLNSP